MEKDNFFKNSFFLTASNISTGLLGFIFSIYLSKLIGAEGIARKKENSAAMKREAPIRVAPKIVAPERDVPGIKASIWKIPMPKAVL